jgi:hypothetical protein
MEKYRLWVSKKRAERKISGPQTEEVRGAILRICKTNENSDKKTTNKQALLLPPLPNDLPSTLRISNKMHLQ